jgi:hypothetical protein
MSNLQKPWHRHNLSIFASTDFFANTVPITRITRGSFGPEQVLVVDDHLTPVINALLTLVQFGPGSIFLC